MEQSFDLLDTVLVGAVSPILYAMTYWDLKGVLLSKSKILRHNYF